jgi:hypothetical protein
LKTRTSGFLASIILVTIIVFLAVYAGFTLYNPNRFTSSNPSCKLDVISGDIQVLKKESLTWEPAVSGSILEPGSRIKTAAGANGLITFSNGTTTKLEPGTDVIIDKILDGEDAEQYTVILKQQLGKTWNQVTKSLGKTVFQIKTPSADINVHGTLFSTEVDKYGKTTVKTTEGRVSVAAQGEEVMVNPGKMVQVQPDQVPSQPADIPAPKYELVITFDKQTVGAVSDPSGSSTGYVSEETAVNQISESSITVDEESRQTIRIPEAKVGEYNLTVQGAADGVGTVSVEGFVNGKSAFLNIGSCNISAAKDTLVQLHYDVLSGLLQQDSSGGKGIFDGKAALASDKSATGANSGKTPPAASVQSRTQTGTTKTEPASGQPLEWADREKPGQLTRWITVGCLLFAIGIVFIVMRRNTGLNRRKDL